MEMTGFQLYNSLRAKLGDEVAQEMITFMKSTIKTEVADLTRNFLTKEDKVEIMRAIYMTSLFNFFAIAATVIGAVITIVSFIQKN